MIGGPNNAQKEQVKTDPTEDAVPSADAKLVHAPSKHLFEQKLQKLLSILKKFQNLRIIVWILLRAKSFPRLEGWKKIRTLQP